MFQSLTVRCSDMDSRDLPFTVEVEAPKESGGKTFRSPLALPGPSGAGSRLMKRGTAADRNHSERSFSASSLGPDFFSFALLLPPGLQDALAWHGRQGFPLAAPRRCGASGRRTRRSWSFCERCRGCPSFWWSSPSGPRCPPPWVRRICLFFAFSPPGVFLEVLRRCMLEVTRFQTLPLLQ